AFMAPEQLSPQWGELGPWTDVYGLGGVLYALIFGSPPYQGQRRTDVLAQVTSPSAVELPAATGAPVLECLRPICEKCLAKRPSQRYASVSDVAADLPMK